MSELGLLAEQVATLGIPSEQFTYLVDRNINSRNVCNTDCTFCAFYRPLQNILKPMFLAANEMRQKLEELAAIGGSRFFFKGTQR